MSKKREVLMEKVAYRRGMKSEQRECIRESNSEKYSIMYPHKKCRQW